MTATSKVLAAVLVALLGGIAARVALDRDGEEARGPSAAGAHVGHGQHGATQAGVDWTRVSDRDLDIAELFVIARRSSVGDALGRLEVLAAGDTVVRDMGHLIAHGLGRFAVAQRQGDPAVYADCREVFQAGCNHGVMEAYFSSPRAATPDAVAPSALDSLCARITPPAAARLVALECAHGMGHGLLARYRGDLDEALSACDYLTQPDAREECHDGVFMENAVRATGSADMRVGDAAVQAGISGRRQEALVRRDDLAYPCNEVGSQYRSSCWKYQALIVVEATRGSPTRTIEACERAPEPFRTSCYFGIGKQATGWWASQDRVAQLCEAVPVAQRTACVAGAVESYLDEMWTIDRALAFCTLVASGSRPSCYQAIGARLAVMRANRAVIARECAQAGNAFAASCMEGAVAGRRR